MSMVMKFDGGESGNPLQYVDCGAGLSLDFSGNVTIHVLFWNRSISSSPRYFLSRTDLTNGFFSNVNRANNTISTFLCNGGIQTEYPTSNYNLRANMKKWIAYTFVADVANYSIYVDGALNISAALIGASLGAPGAVNMYVGAISGALASSVFGGNIAAVFIYNKVLTAGQVAYLVAHPQNPLKDKLKLALTQESLFAGQWRDISGNANHGTVSGCGPIQANNLAGRNVSL